MPEKQQITRDNHYVPQWYQRGFMGKGQHKLFVLDLSPAVKTLANSQTLVDREIEELGPKLAFKEFDLYTTRFGDILNDDIETFLFGKIDKNGADAVRGWIAGDPVKIHRKFQDFFEYMDAQKLRTPKGLDWILKHFHGLPQIGLMAQMQALRQMHCTMWAEGVREIVSASNSTVKFLVSDHPVTIYHPKLAPDAIDCQYPGDPSIELVGSQSIFALDANHCLIITNIEYAENPDNADVLSRRTNARFRGASMARTDAFIRNRKLNEAEVHAINLVLKSRAKKYVAASNSAWLYPEQHCTLSWERIADVLLPQNDLWRFGGEVYIGYEDGTSAYRDKFGRTSKAHEYLTKPPLAGELAPGAHCGCGSGISFQDCCADVLPQRRPTWRVMSIRERNLTLLRGINDILQLNDGQTTWQDVRRNLSNDQVRRIHELHAALWPVDTQLVDLLPIPQHKRSRALYLGILDARTLPESVTGMLAYVDELVLVHPFVNANGIRPAFSPVHYPELFREQTLRSVFLLLILEPDIRAGRIHLVPDPLDYDAGFRDEIMAISESEVEPLELGPIDKALSLRFSRDDMSWAIKRLPVAELKQFLRRRVPGDAEPVTEADIDLVVSKFKQELEDDMLTLTSPVADDSEYRMVKGFARETGLYVASLMGAMVYTNSDTQWARLHETDGVHFYEPDPAAQGAVDSLNGRWIRIPSLTYHHQTEPPGANETTSMLRKLAIALGTGGLPEVDLQINAERAVPMEEDDSHKFKLRASVPIGGFQRTDVSRLVLTFGRMEAVAPVALALFLDPA